MNTERPISLKEMYRRVIELETKSDLLLQMKQKAELHLFWYVVGLSVLILFDIGTQWYIHLVLGR